MNINYEKIENAWFKSKIDEPSNCKELLDYITNLQEENKELRKELELCKKNGEM